MIFATFLVFTFSGCSKDKESGQSDEALFQTTRPTPIKLKSGPEHKSIAVQVKEEVEKMKEIYDVAVIEGEKQLIVAYKVRHLQRFKMGKIEKKLKKRLKQEYPEDQFIVSSDYKIFLEAMRLKDDIEYKDISKKEAKKRFKEIVRLKKETT